MIPHTAHTHTVREEEEEEEEEEEDSHYHSASSIIGIISPQEGGGVEASFSFFFGSRGCWGNAPKGGGRKRKRIWNTEMDREKVVCGFFFSP